MGNPTLIAVYWAAGLGTASVSFVVRRVGGYAPGWQLRCTHCGHVGDAGTSGLIRVGAWSVGRRSLARCSKCNALRVLAVERAPLTE
jgi:hypothetical protein